MKGIIYGIAIISLVFTILLAGGVLAITQCSDGLDNDCDGSTDLSDAGCINSSDNSEALVLGYASGCLSNGQKLKNKCGQTSFSCSHDVCQVCVLITDSGNYTTIDYKCAGLPACGFGDGDSTGVVDTSTPDLTIASPVKNQVYKNRNVLFDITVAKTAKIKKYNPTRQSWDVLCTNCDSYYRAISFRDGQQDVQIMSEDSRGNIDEKTISFFVDSKAPRIRKTLPKKGSFASGEFEVAFGEVNPKSVVLHYGNFGTGYLTKTLNIADCSVIGEIYTCTTSVNLNNYNGQQIDYWFEVTDVADSVGSSKPLILYVDVTSPVINSLNYKVSGRNVLFNVSVTEENFESLTYTDLYDYRMRVIKLCSSLRNGGCITRKTFTAGQHALDITALDEAGNAVAQRIEFTILA
ncbi:hypothetical protein HYW76_01705 [Candidatus Pacearchaeota archaeon]|nr:hypothetical protein [Candidatus Pacearchaeota archaeon]